MSKLTEQIDSTRRHLIAAGLANGASKEDKSMALHVIAENRDWFTGPELINYSERILRPLSGVEVQARFGRVMAAMTCRDEFVDRVAHGKVTQTEAVGEGRTIAAAIEAAFINCFRDYMFWGADA